MVKQTLSKTVFLGAALSVLAGAVVFTAIQLSTASPGVPNPGHSYADIELPVGTWTGLDADTVDGKDSTELGGGSQDLESVLNQGSDASGFTGTTKLGGAIKMTGGSGSYFKLPHLTTAEMHALSPEPGMLIYNTDISDIEIYVPDKWKKVSGGLPVGEACTLDESCETGFCVDGICSASLREIGEACTLDESCETGFCVDGVCCNGVCETCKDCNIPSNEGYCTDISAYEEDDGCTQTCKGCSGGSCVNIPNTIQDNYGSNICTATHYRCDGNGACTAPCSASTVCVEFPDYGFNSCGWKCSSAGQCACYDACAQPGCGICGDVNCGETGPSCICYQYMY